jgi:hypothetical protein
MDLRLVTIDNTWDFTVVDGLPLTVVGQNELTQRALMASFIQPNTIPMLPSLGPHWTEYVTGAISLSEIDSQVRANVNLLMDGYSYVPYYSIKNGTITYSIANVNLSGA